MSQELFGPTDEQVAAIKAELASYESHRQVLFRNQRMLMPLSLIPAAIAGIVGFFTLIGTPEPPFAEDRMEFAFWVFFAVVTLAGGGLWLASRPSTHAQQSLRDRLLPTLFGFVGEMEYAHGTKPLTMDYVPAEAFPSYARVEYGDVVRGRHKWMRFELFELHLRDAGKGGGNTVFDGVVVSFEIPGDFSGLLMATPKLGMVSNFMRDIFGARLSELKSGNDLLDATYDFRTDNPDAAKPLIEGPVGAVLAGLGRDWREPPRVALSNKIGFLLLPTSKDFFELPGVETPASYERHIEPMIGELSRLLDAALLVRRAMAGKEGLEEEGLLN